jgi:hypothetical protein
MGWVSAGCCVGRWGRVNARAASAGSPFKSRSIKTKQQSTNAFSSLPNSPTRSPCRSPKSGTLGCPKTGIFGRGESRRGKASSGCLRPPLQAAKSQEPRMAQICARSTPVNTQVFDSRKDASAGSTCSLTWRSCVFASCGHGALRPLLSHGAQPAMFIGAHESSSWTLPACGRGYTALSAHSGTWKEGKGCGMQACD